MYAHMQKHLQVATTREMLSDVLKQQNMFSYVEIHMHKQRHHQVATTREMVE